MKLSNLISYSHQTFASVLLAFGLLGFLFPHHATGAKRNHQVNLKTIEQTSTPENSVLVPNQGAAITPNLDGRPAAATRENGEGGSAVSR